MKRTQLTAAEKPQATRLKWVAYSLLIAVGVLAFHISAHGAESRVMATAQDSDSYIRTQLESAIRQHPGLAQRPINIESKNQVVTLTGTVANDLEARDLLVRARSIYGVRKVRMNLAVVPGAGKWQALSRRAQKIVQEGKEDLYELKRATNEILKSVSNVIRVDSRLAIINPDTGS